MKKLPMILMLLAPYAIIACNFSNMDIAFLLCVYGLLLVFNMVYAFILPRLGYNGKQVLFWNLIIKLVNIPVVLVIILFAFVMMMVGGEAMYGQSMTIFKIAFLACYLLQISAAAFGLSGFLCFYKQEKLSTKAVIKKTIAQLIPVVDIFASISAYVSLRKEVEL